MKKSLSPFAYLSTCIERKKKVVCICDNAKSKGYIRRLLFGNVNQAFPEMLLPLFTFQLLVALAFPKTTRSFESQLRRFSLSLFSNVAPILRLLYFYASSTKKYLLEPFTTQLSIRATPLLYIYFYVNILCRWFIVFVFAHKCVNEFLAELTYLSWKSYRIPIMGGSHCYANFVNISPNRLPSLLPKNLLSFLHSRRPTPSFLSSSLCCICLPTSHRKLFYFREPTNLDLCLWVTSMIPIDARQVGNFRDFQIFFIGASRVNGILTIFKSFFEVFFYADTPEK